MLDAVNLAIGYPGHPVGQGLTLAVAQGEVLALLGPNGSGKTTWLKTLLGLIEPQAGQVRLQGRELSQWPLPERARCLGYVPQGQVSTFGLSALQMVMLGRTAHLGLLGRPGARDRTIALDALQQVGMAHLADRSVHRMSGGERQLVLIARALAQQPQAVLLDEPTASLDFGNQGVVLRAIDTLAARGLAVLFTTHDPNQALRVAHRAVLLREGRVLAGGPVREVVDAAHLQVLYGAPVREVPAGPGAAPVFLPG